MLKHGWIGVIALALAGAGMLRAAEPDEMRVLILKPQVEGKVESELSAGKDKPSDVLAEMGEYWLGLVCSQPTAALGAQLALPEKQGLVVEQIVPDNPAAKAGIKPYDVLLKADDKPLEAVQDLIAVVNKAKDNKLSLELIREGKKQTVAVTPAKRPEDRRMPGFITMKPESKDQEAIQKWLQQVVPGEPGKPWQFRMFHPGMILPPNTAVPPGAKSELNINVTTHADVDGYRVTITRKSNEPAQIVVKKDKETWETTENDLGKLPEQVRPKVKEMLAQGPFRMGIFGGMSGFGGPNTAVPAPGAVEGRRGAESRSMTPAIEKRLQDMEHQIQQLRKSMDELRGMRRDRRSDKRNSPETKSEPSEGQRT